MYTTPAWLRVAMEHKNWLQDANDGDVESMSVVPNSVEDWAHIPRVTAGSGGAARR
jgi:hypothetical protein